jgi:predicted MFS family arabinose efflux permease
MNQRRLFIASCLALIATSMAFSIRADIIPGLKADFGFTDTQMGTMVGPGLWGFTITIVLGGFLVDAFGMRRLLGMAFFGHVGGTLLTITASSFTQLYLATLMIGLANGLVEAVCNPLVTTLYPESKAKHLNIFHAWWPGGLIIGGLAGYTLTKIMGLDVAAVSHATLSLGWKIKMGLILVPAFSYGALIWGQEFPQTERVQTGVSYGEMLREAFRPMFLLFLVLMMVTAATELGPDQWVGNLLQNLVGIQGILLLVYTAGIMFVLRQFFAGPLVKALTPLGVLSLSSILSAIGLFWLSSSTSAAMVFAAATVFGIGKAYFWPTMIGTVAERFPKGGALLLCLMGGAGMFSVGYLAVKGMGRVQDHYAVQNLSPAAISQVVTNGGLDERKIAATTDGSIKAEVEEAKHFSAMMTYKWVAVLPTILTVIFGGLFFYFRAQGGYEAVRLDAPSRLSQMPRPRPV